MLPCHMGSAQKGICKKDSRVWHSTRRRTDSEASKEYGEAQQDTDHWPDERVSVVEVLLQILLDGGRVALAHH